MNGIVDEVGNWVADNLPLVVVVCLVGYAILAVMMLTA